jgi:hypothetical protein
LDRVESDLAEVAASFGPMSVTKLENVIDAAITVHDPAAVRREHIAAKGCDVEFGNRDDTTGTVSMWGRLSVTDGELFRRRLEQMASIPCRHDPRTRGQRRAAAVGVLGAGGTHLPCTCGRPDCTAAGPDARADAIVIHVLTDQPPDLGPPDQGPDTEPPPDDDPDTEPPRARGPDSDPDSGRDPGPDTGPPDPEPDAGQPRDRNCRASTEGGPPPAGPDRGTVAEPHPAIEPDPSDTDPSAWEGGPASRSLKAYPENTTGVPYSSASSSTFATT